MRAKSLILGNQPGAIPVVCAVCLAAVVACGSPADEERPEGADTTAAVDMVPRTADADSEPDTAPTTGSGLRAELEALADTDVTGTVSLTPGAGGTTVSVQIHGANSGLPYVAEIVSGSCTNPGAVLEEIGRITAGEQGDGEFHEVVDRDLVGTDRSARAVRVRGAGDPTAIVACGNLAP